MGQWVGGWLIPGFQDCLHQSKILATKFKDRNKTNEITFLMPNSWVSLIKHQSHLYDRRIMMTHETQKYCIIKIIFVLSSFESVEIVVMRQKLHVTKNLLNSVVFTYKMIKRFTKEFCFSFCFQKQQKEGLLLVKFFFVFWL